MKLSKITKRAIGDYLLALRGRGGLHTIHAKHFLPKSKPVRGDGHKLVAQLGAGTVGEKELAA